MFKCFNIGLEPQRHHYIRYLGYTDNSPGTLPNFYDTTMYFPYNKYLGYKRDLVRTTKSTTTLGVLATEEVGLSKMEPQCTTTKGTWVSSVLGLEKLVTTMCYKFIELLQALYKS